MKFFLADSQDLVDPSFDFVTERRDSGRVRHRSDQYTHEVFPDPAYDGMLLSKGIVDGYGEVSGRYTTAQRRRLFREGARRFLRLNTLRYPVEVMGDCGAFTYLKEEAPPYSVDEVIEFYECCRFDFGLSVDHVILEYQPEWDLRGRSAPKEVRQRQEITLKLASSFFRRCRAERTSFQPVGVAQGWSPKSYARAVRDLQKMGFAYIALGGMVPLKTPEVLASLEAIAEVRKPSTRLHLLGLTRTEHLASFARLGVASFDSTSPLRQAFKDDRDNYWTSERAYTAIRIPQLEGNPQLQKAVSSGAIDQNKARRLERGAREALLAFDKGRAKLEPTLKAILAYEALFDQARAFLGKAPSARGRGGHEAAYREVLKDAPWKKCPCAVCRALGHQVIVFRGAERNKRRGFHNTWVFYRRLLRNLGLPMKRAA